MAQAEENTKGCLVASIVTAPLISFIADLMISILIYPVDSNGDRLLLLLPWLLSGLAIMSCWLRDRRAMRPSPTNSQAGWRNNFEDLQRRPVDLTPPDPEEILLNQAKVLIYHNRSSASYRTELRTLLQLNDQELCRKVLAVHLPFYTEGHYEWDSDSGYEPQSAKWTVERQLQEFYSQASTPAWQAVLAAPRKKIHGFPQPATV